MKNILQSQQINKPNPLFDSYKLLFDGKDTDLDKIPTSVHKPLIHWVSFSRDNIEICQKLNKYFMYVPSKILIWILYYKIDIDNRFVKRMKPVYDNKFDFLKDYLKRYFNWSEREYNFNKKVIDKLVVDKEVMKELNETFGFSQQECKKLDLDYVVYKKTRKDSGSQSLFNFTKKTG
jgi:hypothetical protein